MDFVANFDIENNEFDAEFNVEQNEFDAILELNPAGAAWGGITGNISEQTDLANALNSKASINSVTELGQDINNISTTIQGYGDIVTHNTDEFATAQQGALAESAVQSVTTGNDDGTILVDNTSVAVKGLKSAAYTETTAYATSQQGALADTAVQPSDLSAVATSGDYDDLLNKPSIPDAQVQSDWTQTDSSKVDFIKNKPALGTMAEENASDYTKTSGLANVAISGSYNDLNNKPTIPTVPTNVSAFNNDAGYITGIDSTDVTTALGYTPYDNTNPDGFISGIDSSDVTTALGYTPYNDTNPDGYITGINSSDVTSALGYTPVNPSSLSTVATSGSYSDLTNKPTINDLTSSAQQDALNSGATTTNIGQIATNTQNISDEVTNRQNADYNLQQQIDAITSASDVTDIVGTYAELQAYDTTSLPNNSIIKVLQDENRNDETTYYRWVITGGVGAWTLIGEEGPYYTKSDANSTFVPQTRTINNKALSSNITLSASDVGALPSGTTIGSGVLTIQKNGTTIDTFGANDTGNTTVNITVPTNNNELTNGAGYITSSALSGYVESTDLATVATTGAYSDLTGTPTIPAAQVQSDWNQTNTSAVDYIKNKPTIPSGVTVDQTYDGTSANAQSGVAIAGELTNYVESSDLATVATSGSYNDLTNKPSIPAAQVNSDWNASSGVAQILNKPTIPTVPTNISAFNNDSGYITGITSSDVTTALGYTPYNSSNPNGYTSNVGTVTSVNNISPVNGNVSITIPTVPTNVSAFNNDSGYITSSALSGYATETWVGNQGYITGITSSDVTNALGYTPYNSTNPNGYITSSALSGYEQTSNKVTSISSSSTNTQYPSAKCVYDEFADSVKYATSENFYCWYSQGATPEKLYTTTDILSQGTPIFKADGTYYDRNLYMDNTFLYPSFHGGAYSRQQSGDIIPFRVNLTDVNSNSLNIKQVDGQWTSGLSYIKTLSTTNLNVGIYDLSGIIQTYLPDDEYSYEVKIYLEYESKNTSATKVLFNDIPFFYGDAYGTGNQECKSMTGSIIISPLRTFSMEIANSKPAVLRVSALGFRRLGTNG